VPNGCGLFCFQALQLLSATGQNDPVAVLREYSENFLRLSVEEQTLFNTETRRKIHEYSLTS
ncbi:type III secretion system effector deubiquitinase SseL, partial [Salmonella enterica subsp. houtenae serovar 48:g,z51:-]|nr:type III secretion system effector deubiquitinase SseL [Salmonella enterica subsp. houtenae serovar 48:g,z51:-]